MTDLVYRGVAYRKEDLVEDRTGAAPSELVYRGVEHDGVSALKAAQPVVQKTAAPTRVYRGLTLPAFRGAVARA